MIFKILFLIISIIIVYALIILLCSINFNTGNADFALILGHKLENNKISDVLLYRLKKTIKYLNDNPNCKVILSGGTTPGNSISEAYVMKEYLLINNIEENKIICEDKSQDTIENIDNCIKLIPKNSKVVIISSNYHILRSRMICKLLGLKTKGIGAYTPPIDLIKHLGIEEVYMFIHFYRIMKRRSL